MFPHNNKNKPKAGTSPTFARALQLTNKTKSPMLKNIGRKIVVPPNFIILCI